MLTSYSVSFLPNTPEPSRSAQVVRCPNCNAFGYDDDDFCACCGAAMGNRCAACGALVRHPVAFFCTRCGAELPATEG